MSDAKALYLMHRMSPGDLGLKFEEVFFNVRDERSGGAAHSNIAGWWISAADVARDRCVVMLHGYGDAKVGAIAWARPFHDLGFHILAIDLRAHGQSGGRNCTAGYFERHDVSQVIDQICAERPEQARRIVLFGVSLGAAVAAATAVLREQAPSPAPRSTDDAPGDLAAVILESPIADFRSAAAAHIATLGLPIDWLIRSALWLAERLSGARFDDVRPLDLIPTIRCPLLVISPNADGIYLSRADAATMEAAVVNRPAGAGPGQYHHLPDASHMMGVLADPERYTRILSDFLRGVS